MTHNGFLPGRVKERKRKPPPLLFVVSATDPRRETGQQHMRSAGPWQERRPAGKMREKKRRETQISLLGARASNASRALTASPPSIP